MQETRLATLPHMYTNGCVCMDGPGLLECVNPLLKLNYQSSLHLVAGSSTRQLHTRSFVCPESHNYHPGTAAWLVLRRTNRFVFQEPLVPTGKWGGGGEFSVALCPEAKESKAFIAEPLGLDSDLTYMQQTNLD